MLQNPEHEHCQHKQGKLWSVPLTIHRQNLDLPLQPNHKQNASFTKTEYQLKSSLGSVTVNCYRWDSNSRFSKGLEIRSSLLSRTFRRSLMLNKTLLQCLLPQMWSVFLEFHLLRNQACRDLWLLVHLNILHRAVELGNLHPGSRWEALSPAGRWLAPRFHCLWHTWSILPRQMNNKDELFYNHICK